MSGRIWVTKVTDAPRASTEERDVLGSHRCIGNKCYKYVKLLASVGDADTNIAANGDVVGYTDFSAHTISPDAVDSDEGGAGIVVNFANWDGDVSANYSSYMWIQIKGPAVLSQSIGGSASARNRISYDTGSTDLTFEKCTTLETSQGYYIAAKEAYLNCPY